MVNYKLKISNLSRKIIPFISIIYILPLVALFFGKNGRINYKAGKFRDAYSDLSISESLWCLPKYTLAMAKTQENLFGKTGSVSYLYYAYVLFDRAGKIDPLNWKIPFKTYEFLNRIKKNARTGSELTFIEKAIELNPYKKELHKLLIDEYKKEGKYRQSRLAEYRMKKIFDITTQKIH